MIRNFAVPVGIGLAGGVAGLMASTQGFGYVFPYALMQSGMNSNALVDLSAGNVTQLVAMSVAYVVLAGVVACGWLRRSDIHA